MTKLALPSWQGMQRLDLTPLPLWMGDAINWGIFQRHV